MLKCCGCGTSAGKSSENSPSSKSSRYREYVKSGFWSDMGAKQITPMSEVDAYLEEQIQRIEQQTIYNLSYVGERCLNEARSTNSYKDQTGNLRSSIGYVIDQERQDCSNERFYYRQKWTRGNARRGGICPPTRQRVPVRHCLDCGGRDELCCPCIGKGI